MDREIRILGGVRTQLLEGARAGATLECCGLVAGRDSVITHAFPAANVAANPATSYEIAPEQLFRLMREIRNAGLEMLGIYHSHPNGPNVPSPRDIDRAYYPGAAYFIVSPLGDASQPVRAFSIRDGRTTELGVQIV
jgi:proteasome lid subunit RPN8/RPN11